MPQRLLGLLNLTLRSCITARGLRPDRSLVLEDRPCRCLHVTASWGAGSSRGREAEEGWQPLCPSQPGGHGLPPAGGVMARMPLLPPASHFQGLYEQWGQAGGGGGRGTIGPLRCLVGDGVTWPRDPATQIQALCEMGQVPLGWLRMLLACRDG